MSEAKKFPTVTHRERAQDPEGTMAGHLNAMMPMCRGPLPDDGPRDAVDEMERLLEWATRDLPEEAP